MSNIIKGLNTAIVLHENHFLALAMKIKNAADEESLFFFQLPQLHDLLLVLQSQLQRLSIAAVQNGKALTAAVSEAHQNLIAQVPPIDVSEITAPAPGKRVASLAMKPNADQNTLHLILQNERVISLAIMDIQAEFVIRAIIQALNNIKERELIAYLTERLDFLPLYDVDLSNTDSMDYNQYPQEPWKQNLFAHHLALLYCCKTANGEQIICGAVVKTNVQEGTPAAEDIAFRLQKISPHIKKYQGQVTHIFSRQIPAQQGAVLTLEQALKPLHTFYLEKIAE
ncbi:YjeJ family protein [Budvicia diplopodorum]|uniref:YjeJ family protein n=1 Tax=Budvicia diplopodorum TaxID=1119056 RepID=UPI00135B9108|nr:YjeJ family protein [Budvicia diplopodorum]